MKDFVRALAAMMCFYVVADGGESEYRTVEAES
jgi:hypothetical protein